MVSEDSLMQQPAALAHQVLNVKVNSQVEILFLSRISFPPTSIDSFHFFPLLFFSFGGLSPEFTVVNSHWRDVYFIYRLRRCLNDYSGIIEFSKAKKKQILKLICFYLISIVSSTYSSTFFM